jgi:hypothetical protein
MFVWASCGFTITNATGTVGEAARNSPFAQNPNCSKEQ